MASPLKPRPKRLAVIHQPGEISPKIFSVKELGNKLWVSHTFTGRPPSLLPRPKRSFLQKRVQKFYPKFWEWDKLISRKPKWPRILQKVPSANYFDFEWKPIWKEHHLQNISNPNSFMLQQRTYWSSGFSVRGPSDKVWLSRADGWAGEANTWLPDWQILSTHFWQILMRTQLGPTNIVAILHMWEARPGCRRPLIEFKWPVGASIWYVKTFTVGAFVW